MKILVIGNCGREFAFAEIFKKNNNVFIYPSNNFLRDIYPTLNVDNNLIKSIQKENFDLCIIGPEKYLEEGLVDKLQRKNIIIFGPTKKCAKLETSKLYAKKFMKKYNIPTAEYFVIRNIEEGNKKIKHFPIVLKYDGLAAGKGVQVCWTKEEAEKYLIDVFKNIKFGGIKPVIAEEYFEGEELSIICAISNYDYLIFPPARDYKRLYNKNLGPNTGGMGAVASVNLIKKKVLEEIKNKIIEPTIKGLKKEKLDYRGFLYFGLMLTKEGAKVLEYNCRFGDPEAQAILPLVKGDFAKFLKNLCLKKFDKKDIKFSNKWSICIVAAAPGYPDNPEKNLEIFGLEKIKKCKIFYAGIDKIKDKCFTNGGRVLALGYIHQNFNKAREIVYQEIKKIKWKDIHYRKDIGKEFLR